MLTEAHRGQADHCDPEGVSVSQSSSSVVFDGAGKPAGERNVDQSVNFAGAPAGSRERGGGGGGGDGSVRSSFPLAGAAQPAPFGCRCYDTASSQGHHSKSRQSTKPRTVDLSNGKMSEAVCVLVFFTVGLLLSLSVSRLLASPSRSWTVRVHPGNVTHWRPSSDSVSGVPPNARLPPNCPVQHSCSLPSDASLLSHTNLGICILSLSLYVSSGSVSRLLRRSLTLLENAAGIRPRSSKCSCAWGRWVTIPCCGGTQASGR